MKKQMMLLLVLVATALLLQQSKCNNQTTTRQRQQDAEPSFIQVHVASYEANTSLEDIRVTLKPNTGSPFTYLTNDQGNTAPIIINNNDSLILSQVQMFSDTIVIEQLATAKLINMYMQSNVLPLTGETLYGSVYLAGEHTTAFKNMKIFNLNNPADSCRSDTNGIYNLKIANSTAWFHVGYIDASGVTPDTTRVKVTVSAGNSTRLDVFFDDTKMDNRNRRAH